MSLLYRIRAAVKAFNAPDLVYKGEWLDKVLKEECSGNRFVLLREQYIGNERWPRIDNLAYQDREAIRRLLCWTF